MKIDVIYRTIDRAGGRLLRVRLRRPEGLSTVLMFRDPQDFESLVARVIVSDPAKQELENASVMVAQMRQRVHSNAKLDLTPEELADLGVSSWNEPQRFNLSYERAGDGQVVLTAREVDPSPGGRSLNIKAFVSKEQFAQFVAKINFQPSEIRDANLYGTQSKRQIDEDEVDLLFDSIRH